jgi:hypothetical protein
LPAKEDDGELGVCILEREVNVAGGRGTEVGDFAFNPDVAVLLFDKIANLRDKVTHSPDAAESSRLLKGEVELRRDWIVGSHWKEFNCWEAETTARVRWQACGFQSS